MSSVSIHEPFSDERANVDTCDSPTWTRVLFSEKITYALRITHYVFFEEDAK